MSSNNINYYAIYDGDIQNKILLHFLQKIIS